MRRLVTHACSMTPMIPGQRSSSLVLDGYHVLQCCTLPLPINKLLMVKTNLLMLQTKL